MGNCLESSSSKVDTTNGAQNLTGKSYFRSRDAQIRVLVDEISGFDVRKN